METTRRRSPARLSGVLFVLLLVTAGHRSLDTADRTYVAQTTEAFRFNNAADWISFADQVSTVSILEEDVQPVPKDAIEGSVPAVLTLRVDNTLWMASGARSDKAIEPGGTVQVFSDGYWLKEGELFPVRSEDGPRLEVGSTYLVALFEDDGQYGLLTSDSVFELDATRQRTIEERSDASPGQQVFAGMDLTEIQAVLSGAAPRAEVSDLLDVPPLLRGQRSS